MQKVHSQVKPLLLNLKLKHFPIKKKQLHFCFTMNVAIYIRCLLFRAAAKHQAKSDILSSLQCLAARFLSRTEFSPYNERCMQQVGGGEWSLSGSGGLESIL